MRKLLAILLMLAVCVGAIWGAAHASTPGDANGDELQMSWFESSEKGK